VFRIDSPIPDLGSSAPRLGLAARYPRDRGIARDPDVLMSTGFDAPSWQKLWSYVSPRGSSERIERAPQLGFVPLDGAALQVRIPRGQNIALDMGYRFAEKHGSEPEEIYFRYYLRFANDWRPAVDGGKLPGISATYAQTGWGGRKADGTTGWSLRGQFFAMPEMGNPFHAATPIGTYAYHADMAESFGDAWPWTANGRGLLERDRWYCIEQYVKVNTPGSKDGILRAWIDGDLVFEKSDLHLRDVATIRIEQIWMNVYYGGVNPSPSDLHLFIDNVVVARKYIGPRTTP
jgi:polysaccharide lyase-like protein